MIKPFYAAAVIAPSRDILIEHFVIQAIEKKKIGCIFPGEIYKVTLEATKHGIKSDGRTEKTIDFLLVYPGKGAVNVASIITYINCHYNVLLFLNIGFAGLVKSRNNTVKINDLLIASNIKRTVDNSSLGFNIGVFREDCEYSSSFDSFKNNLQDRINYNLQAVFEYLYKDTNHKVHSGLIYSNDKFYDNRTQIASVLKLNKSNHDHIAVDSESAAIAEVLSNAQPLRDHNNETLSYHDKDGKRKDLKPIFAVAKIITNNVAYSNDSNDTNFSAYKEHDRNRMESTKILVSYFVNLANLIAFVYKKYVIDKQQ